MNPMYSGIVLFDHTTDTTLQPLLVQKVVTAVGLLPRLALCQLVARSLVRVSGPRPRAAPWRRYCTFT